MSIIPAYPPRGRGWRSLPASGRQEAPRLPGPPLPSTFLATWRRLPPASAGPRRVCWRCPRHRCGPRRRPGQRQDRTPGRARQGRAGAAGMVCAVAVALDAGQCSPVTSAAPSIIRRAPCGTAAPVATRAAPRHAGHASQVDGRTAHPDGHGRAARGRWRHLRSSLCIRAAASKPILKPIRQALSLT